MPLNNEILINEIQELLAEIDRVYISPDIKIKSHVSKIRALLPPRPNQFLTNNGKGLCIYYVIQGSGGGVHDFAFMGGGGGSLICQHLVTGLTIFLSHSLFNQKAILMLYIEILYIYICNCHKIHKIYR